MRAALTIFAEKGEAGLVIRSVADRAGITPMAIYRHFKNKQDLVDSLVLDGIETWRQRVADIKPCAPLDWLLAIGDAYLNFALNEPSRYEAAFLVSSPAALKYPDDFIAGESPAISLLLELLTSELNLSSRKTQLTPMELVVIFVSLVQGLVTLYRGGRIAGNEKSFRTLYRRALSNCLDSFR